MTVQDSPSESVPGLSPNQGNCRRLAAHSYQNLCVAALALLSLSGCGVKQWVHNGFKVGPEYCKPAVPMASQWIDYQDQKIKTQPAELAAWWTAFRDPALNDLIQTAARQNVNLRVAGMRILEARYRRQIAAGELFPQLQDVTGGYSRNKASANLAFSTPNLWTSTTQVGLNAAWELDFWGRFRRAVESADAELDASIENYDDVLVLLLAEVASSYIDLRTFQQRRAYALKNVASQEGSLKVAEDKLRHEVASQRDVEQARTVLEQTKALVPEFEAGERLANNRLCTLLGIPPQDLSARIGSAAIPQTPAEVAVGIPADLVRRRPDVRKVEREVAAQSARIGIATSDLYPHFTINGTFGYAAQSFGNLFDGNRSTVGGIGPAFRWDVLNYGRLVNAVHVEDARFQQAAYAYQEKVLEAGREIEDGIIHFLKSHQSSICLDASAKAAENTRTITTNQYRQGIVDFTAVYLAESDLARAQDRSATAHGQIAHSLIELYRALGGGWEIRLQEQGDTDPAASPAPAVAPPPQYLALPEPREPAPVPPAPLASEKADKAEKAEQPEAKK